MTVHNHNLNLGYATGLTIYRKRVAVMIHLKCLLLREVNTSTSIDYLYVTAGASILVGQGGKSITSPPPNIFV